MNKFNLVHTANNFETPNFSMKITVLRDMMLHGLVEI